MEYGNNRKGIADVGTMLPKKLTIDKKYFRTTVNC